MPVRAVGEQTKVSRGATSVPELTHVGLQLFFERGFDETTVTDIASAAGISRRTFFRYFASKNDLPWGDFDVLVSGLRDRLGRADPCIPMRVVLHETIVEFNRFPASEQEYHRKRMALLLNVPSLVAHSTLRYETWRDAIARFVASRLGVASHTLQPQVIAWAYQAASLASYEVWLQDTDDSLVSVLDEALTTLEREFGGSL